jgi:hypothetical protein
MHQKLENAKTIITSCMGLLPNSVAFSPQAHYSDRATATCRRSQCQLLRIEGVALSEQRIPRPLIRFSWPEPLHFHCTSSSIILTRLSGPVPDPLLLRKSGGAGNRTRDLWICSKELWSLDHSGGLYEPTSVSNNKLLIPMWDLGLSRTWLWKISFPDWLCL